MNCDQELNQVAEQYEAQGYEVIRRPGPGDLPSFAKDFGVDLLARRGTERALVQVKETRADVAADTNLARYAEITNAQPGWRFDLVILKSESPGARDLRGAEEPSEEAILQMLAEAEALVRQGHLRPAALIAWAALEAAMRRRLSATGEEAGRGAPPREMLNELFSIGIFSVEEFPRLEKAWRLRNEIVHGFVTPTVDADIVQTLLAIGRRLLAEAQPVGQPA